MVGGVTLIARSYVQLFGVSGDWHYQVDTERAVKQQSGIIKHQKKTVLEEQKMTQPKKRGSVLSLS